jgi:hypothetical protein
LFDFLLSEFCLNFFLVQEGKVVHHSDLVVDKMAHGMVRMRGSSDHGRRNKRGHKKVVVLSSKSIFERVPSIEEPLKLAEVKSTVVDWCEFWPNCFKR